jgi:hypothetical protein
VYHWLRRNGLIYHLPLHDPEKLQTFG